MILGLSIAVVLLAVLSLALGYVLWSRSRIQRGVWARLDPQDTSRDGFARMVAHLSLGSLVEGNAVTLLENGAFWDALRESIATAERSVHFETFLWKAGELSASLVDAFCERARAGVDVRLIVDGEGGKLMSDDERERLRAAGVDLRLYRPRRFAHLGSYNGRDHRKLAVIDGRVAFIGGHCVTDEWTGDAQDREHFRDMTIRLEGPVVNHVQAAFSENWTEVSGRLLAGEDHFPALDPAGEASVHLAYLGDARRVSAVKTLHVLAIESARESLLIMNPYFLPDDGAIEALGRATARGVRVRVMTPTLEATDNPLVVHAMMRELPRLLDAGLEVYGYDRTLLHQKVLSVDGCWSVVGSVNFDPRSFEINEEIAASVFDRALASKIEAAFDADVAHCVRYGLEHAEKRSVGSRLADHLAWGCVASSELRVVTWNIRTGRGLDGRVDLDRVARVLAPLDAEVVALQELDVSRARTRGVDQPRWLAERLGMHATFCGAVEDADGGRYGHALLTRRPPDRADVTLLPRLPLREQRGAIDVDVHTSLGPVRVLSVHLGLLELERVLQVRPLTAIARRAERPMVLLGDLNASAQMPSMRLLRRAFADASARTPAHTWHARFPVRRLDYALIRGLRSVGSRVLSEGDAARASDHLPLAVDLRTEPP